MAEKKLTKKQQAEMLQQAQEEQFLKHVEDRDKRFTRLKLIEPGTPGAGRVYPWSTIAKLYNSLGCPDCYYNPTVMPFKQAAWFMLLSERATGKTTNVILYCLCMWWLYGTSFLYVRDSADMIAPKNAKTLFDTVNAYGYIHKLTDGLYNSMVYDSRAWYMCKRDETGKIVDRCPERCAMVTSLDQVSDLKSALNLPRCDMVVFDEFVPLNPMDVRQNDPHDFILLSDLLSTVFRLRRSGSVIMLGNTLDMYNHYYSDLGVATPLKAAKLGDYGIVDTGETHVYFELIAPPREYREQKDKFVKRFFDFDNEELNAITGRGTYSVKQFPLFPGHKGDKTKFKVLDSSIFIKYGSEFLQLQTVLHDDVGLCVWVRPGYPRDVSKCIILQSEPITESWQAYGLGPPMLEKFLVFLWQQHKFYFSTNQQGMAFCSYLSKCRIYLDY